MPDFVGLESWINSVPLTRTDLLGKVVLVDFWTYSCVNCLRTLPHLMAWHQNYAERGLVVIGIHSPEFKFEGRRDNVETAVRRLNIKYPIALDNQLATWSAFRNRYWPAHYFVDRQGRIRYHHFGEGGYRQSEEVIRKLLAEDGGDLPIWTDADATDRLDVRSIGTPETYLGYERQEYLGSPEAVRFGGTRRYSVPERPAMNVFYLDGDWEIGAECAIPKSAGARLIYRYRAAEANIVLAGAGEQGSRGAGVEVGLDGQPLDKKDAGEDIYIEDARAVVRVDEPRMYRLVDTRGVSGEHLLELRFPEPGIRCYAITFG